jgi:hypothetical protein
VDEAMIGFKGRFHLKQYMPGKPTKWGIKAQGLADSTNGYLLKCQLYRGRKETKDQDLLLGEQVVLQMTEEYVGKWHHVYFDNFFTSTKLVKLHLLGQKDWPKEFRNPKMLKPKRGESWKLQHESVTAVVWHDKRDVLLSFQDLTEQLKRK